MKIDQSVVGKALSAAYEKAINGMEVKNVKVADSAYDLARDYSKSGRTVRQNATSLINWQCSKTGLTGFVTGLPGGFGMLAGVPADLTCVFFIQLRMIAAIAIMAGYDPKSDQVRTMSFACLTGNSLETVLKEAGVTIGKKMATQYIKNRITRETINKINQAVGFRLVTKFGEKGVINLGKCVPFVGGVIGGAFDVASTKIIGKVAKKVFIED